MSQPWLSSIKLIILQPTYTLLFYPLIARTLFNLFFFCAPGQVLTCLTISSNDLLAIHLLLPAILCHSPHLLRLGLGLCQPSPFCFCINKPSFYYYLHPGCGSPPSFHNKMFWQHDGPSRCQQGALLGQHNDVL